MNWVGDKYIIPDKLGMLSSTRIFEQEVEKYCYMWRDGGQFSTKKYNLTNS